VRQASKIKGLKTIIGIDRIPERLELAKSLGATNVSDNSTGLDIVKEIKGLTGGRGTTITLDCVGDIGVITDGFEATAKLGQMILVGSTPLGSELKFPPGLFLTVSRP
jgi:threonine dehydrogenase-like Zn-dependent dehydrogenase